MIDKPADPIQLSLYVFVIKCRHGLTTTYYLNFFRDIRRDYTYHFRVLLRNGVWYENMTHEPYIDIRNYYFRYCIFQEISKALFH